MLNRVREYPEFRLETVSYGNRMNGLVFRFARWCPGAFGLWLRQKLFPRFFHSCGRGVLFGRFVECIASERICLGDGVVLANSVTLDAGRAFADPAIILEDNVFIGTGTNMCADGNGYIKIGAGANFSSWCRVRAEGPLEVGTNCLLAAYSELGNPQQVDKEERWNDHAGEEADRLGVADGCWLGVRMHVMPGVTIGNDTIVGAHSVVGQDLPACVVAVGRPATVLHKR